MVLFIHFLYTYRVETTYPLSLKWTDVFVFVRSLKSPFILSPGLARIVILLQTHFLFQLKTASLHVVLVLHKSLDLSKSDNRLGLAFTQKSFINLHVLLVLRLHIRCQMQKKFDPYVLNEISDGTLVKCIFHVCVYQLIIFQ